MYKLFVPKYCSRKKLQPNVFIKLGNILGDIFLRGSDLSELSTWILSWILLRCFHIQSVLNFVCDSVSTEMGYLCVFLTHVF